MPTFQLCFPLRPFGAAAVAGLIGLGCLAGAPRADAAESAVVLMYHRFGEDTAPATNIRLDQFEAHLAEIAERGYTVLPIPEILASLRNGRALPDRTIGLSIDDAFLSVYTEAWPRLRDAGLPFTLFVATDSIDKQDPGYMSWDQIRELARAGVTIGSQTASRVNLVLASRGRKVRDIVKSNRRFQEELSRKPRLFAYPFGAMSLEARDVIIEHGFTAAFGQHSGVVHPGSRFHFLPRFAMSAVYGDIGRFRLRARALPLAVKDVTPPDPLLSARTNPPSFGFTVTGEALRRIGTLACYASGQGKARIERLGRARIEVRLDKPLSPGRARINCTMPARKGRWRWYGTQFYVPRP